MGVRGLAATGVLLSGVGGCGPNDGVDEPTFALGSPSQNLVTVRFRSDVPGIGSVAWELDGDWREVSAGDEPSREHEALLWLPSGVRVRVRPSIVDAAGAVREGPTRRVEVPDAPDDLHFRLRKHDRDRSRIGDGLVLTNVYDEEAGVSYAVVIDALARVRWWVAPDRPDQEVLRVRPGRDGRSIVFARWAMNHKRDPDDGFVTRLSLGAPQRRTDTRAVAFHHDFDELPGGRFAWLSWVYEEDVAVNGHRLDVAADALRMADEGAVAGEEVVVYDFLEDYPQEPWWTCGHMGTGQFAGRWNEWTHGNSLAWDDEAQGLRGVSRYWDAVWEIGLDDGLRWQLGGPHATIDAPRMFRHPHASELTGDRLILFSNGDHGEPPIVSEIVAVDLELEGGTAREAWSFPDPAGEFTTWLGDARALPGGNVLVAWSPRGLLQEFTPDGDVVWEAELEGKTVGRLTWTDELRVE